MSRHEDVSVDPAITEAVINIKQAIRAVALAWNRAAMNGDPVSHDLAGAQADLEQAVRFLEGTEEPS